VGCNPLAIFLDEGRRPFRIHIDLGHRHHALILFRIGRPDRLAYSSRGRFTSPIMSSTGVFFLVNMRLLETKKRAEPDGPALPA
jgi:hypothetical protein